MLSASQSHSMSDRGNLGKVNRAGFLGLFGSDVGNTLEKAKSVPSLKKGSSYKRSGDVGGKDLDFYKVKLTAPTQFSARLENRDRKNDKDPITLSIVDSKGMAMTGTTPFSQTIKAGKTQTVSGQLAAGTYYVRLESSKGSNQNYKMRLSAD
jgi:hypothetical protein